MPLQIATDTPTLENTFVARLRELKGDRPEVNYPRINPPANSTGVAIGAQNLNKAFGNFHTVKQINLEIRPPA